MTTYILIGLALAVVGLLSGGFLLCALRALFPALPALPFLLGYFLFNILLALLHARPISRINRWVGKLADTWLAIVLSLFFGAIPLFVAYLVLVPLLHAISPATFRIAALGLLTLIAIMDAYGIINARRTRVRRFDCHISKRAGRPSLHIAHLSDLHLGYTADVPVIDRLVQQVNGLTPDIICITGDMFTENIWKIRNLDAFADALRGLHAPLGVYACLGNHDAGKGAEALPAFFERAGIRLLRDETVQLPGGITLAGRLDKTPGGHTDNTRLTPSALLAGSDPAQPTVILDHQPAEIDAIRDAGGDLLLCGHTHGGEFFPIHLFVRHFFPHYYGQNRNGDLITLVSPGTYAAMPPMRIGSRSEIFDIHLTMNETEA